MKKLNFGAGVIKHIETRRTGKRELTKVNEEDVVEMIHVTFTLVEAVKVLFVAIKNIFKGLKKVKK